MNKELEKIAYVYGDVCLRRKKQRRKRQKLLVIELLIDYAKNSTLHGLRYIADQALNILERFFWFITVFGSIALCSFYIYNVVQKWRTSPVIVTVNGRLSSVGSVPFPAVTICPHLKVNPEKYNYSTYSDMYRYQYISSPDINEEYMRYLHINSLCDYGVNDFGPSYNVTNSSMVEDIILASPSVDDIFFLCKWRAKTFNSTCASMFSRVITADGVCYTFNGLAAKDIFEDSIQEDFKYTESEKPQMGWSIEDGYNYSFKHFFPRRGRVFGSDADLSVLLVNDPDKGDRQCNKLFTGYKIYLHHPADMPQSSIYSYAALPNQLSSVAISFHELNSDNGLVDYDPRIRQCYFPTDRSLRYFKIYTAKNCQAECLSNATYSLCKCVGFEMPYHNQSEICFPTIDNQKCMDKAKDFMAEQERMVDLGLIQGGCHCLPACNTVEYDAEILKTDFRFDVMMKDFSTIFGVHPSSSYSAIDLFFKKPHFVTMQRRELFGVTDLLANIGGLLGVFLGFSFLSLIEIIYFLTVRVGFILKRDLEEEKSKEKSKMNDEKIK